jgi:hypothetical protein
MASAHSRPAARSIDPSARHAVGQLPTAASISREDALTASRPSSTDWMRGASANALAGGGGGGATAMDTTGAGASAIAAIAGGAGADAASRAWAAQPTSVGKPINANVASPDLKVHLLG